MPDDDAPCQNPIENILNETYSPVHKTYSPIQRNFDGNYQPVAPTSTDSSVPPPPTGGSGVPEKK
jgi:hypothetical protein